MKNKIFKACVGNLPAAVAIISFVLFSSVKQPTKISPSSSVAKECCSGYTITRNQLKHFMLDSLHKTKFQGGVFARKDLLASIKNLPETDDSVYLLVVLENLQLDTKLQKTDLAITSPNAADVIFLRVDCRPCPNKPCCGKKIGTGSIKWSCINYIPYSDTTTATQTNSFSFSE